MVKMFDVEIQDYGFHFPGWVNWIRLLPLLGLKPFLWQFNKISIFI